MSRKSDHRPKPAPAQVARHQSPGPGAHAFSFRFSRQQLWLGRFALLLLIPCFVLVLVEVSLRLVGFGYPTSFFVRFDADSWVTNDRFAWHYFSKKTVLQPFLFKVPIQKRPGTVRICILGESAAMGTPDPAFSFGRILEAILNREYPEIHFEVMNAAMRGINSHVVREICRDCARHQIDVFIVYMGNNEVVGIHAPTPGAPKWSQSLTLLRAADWTRTTRLGELLADFIHPDTGARQDMEYFRRQKLLPDDDLRQKLLKNFRANLQDILKNATKSGAKVLLSTVAVNLRDFAPLGSLHRAGLTAGELVAWEEAYKSGIQLGAKGKIAEATDRYLAASRVDDHFADLQFRLGRCYESRQDWAGARFHYSLACDRDALQFRSDSRVNEIIRHAAQGQASQGVTLVDMERRFAESDLSVHGIPGGKLFYEHVHPTFAGNYLIARESFKALETVLKDRLKGGKEVPSIEICAQEIGYTPYDDVNVQAAMARLTGAPPFLDQLDHFENQTARESEIKTRLASFGAREAERSLEIYTMALRSHPDEWPIRYNLALFLTETKQPGAVEHLKSLVLDYPQEKHFRIGLANALMEEGDMEKALVELKQALRYHQEDEELRKRVRNIEERLRR